jgi:hypothetical protein
MGTISLLVEERKKKEKKIKTKCVLLRFRSL